MFTEGDQTMFTMTIKTDNAAFDDDASMELSRILLRVAGELADVPGKYPLRDINGNTVGHYTIT